MWSTIQLAGHPCDIYEPPQLNEHRFVVIYLHGVRLAGLADHPAFVEEFAHRGLPVVCPHIGPCWWTDRICPEFDPSLTAERHVLDNVLPFVTERRGAVPPRIGLLGTSMGGQGALRLAFKHADRFPIVVALAPAIDYQLRWQEGDEALQAMYSDAEDVRQDTATLHVHPLHWPRHTFFACDPADERWYESSDRLRMKLNALGIPHEADLTTTGGGHGWTYYDRMAARAIGFIAERLERERLRVV